MTLSNHRVLIVSLTASASGIVCLLAGAIWFIAPLREMNFWNEGIVQKLEDVKASPPNGVTAEEWQFVVGWTQTAFPNVFYSPAHVADPERLVVFKRQLDWRLENDVDMATIRWIWDEMELIGKNGRTYAAGYRPIAPCGKAHLDEQGNPPIWSCRTEDGKRED